MDGALLTRHIAVDRNVGCGRTLTGPDAGAAGTGHRGGILLASHRHGAAVFHIDTRAKTAGDVDITVHLDDIAGIIAA